MCSYTYGLTHSSSGKRLTPRYVSPPWSTNGFSSRDYSVVSEPDPCKVWFRDFLPSTEPETFLTGELSISPTWWDQISGWVQLVPSEQDIDYIQETICTSPHVHHHWYHAQQWQQLCVQQSYSTKWTNTPYYCVSQLHAGGMWQTLRKGLIWALSSVLDTTNQVCN